MDNTIQLPDTAANTGPLRQTISRTVGGQTVHSAVDCIGDATDGSLVAAVANAAPATNAAGLVTRNIPSGTQTVAGTVGLAAGGNAIGTVTVNNGTGTAAVNVQDGGNSLTVDGAVTVSGTVGATVTNWPASQAVTGPLTDTQLRATAVPVSGTFFQATQPVSGTFWQTTQPVSGPLTDAQLRAAAVAVSGTFWQTTQPVSGPLTDTQLRACAIAVSGTFWQATQPVSGPLTNAELRATPVPVSGTVAVSGNVEIVNDVGNPLPVSGTFWQATQPVSGTFWQATQPVSGPLTDTQLRASAVNMSGTVVVSSGTVSVSNAFALDATLTGGTAKAINRGGAKGATTAADVTSTAQGADHQSLDVQLYHGTAAIDPRAITPPTLTKGTQGATGLSVQSLKDAGRSVLNFYMAAPVATAATDTAQSLTAFSGSGTVAATLTPAVIAAGKTYRIQGLSFVYQAGSAAGSVTFTLRVNTSGTASATAPALGTWTVGAVAAGFGVLNVALPDGLEIPAAAGLAVTMLGRGSNNAALAIGFGQATINGYTY